MLLMWQIQQKLQVQNCVCVGLKEQSWNEARAENKDQELGYILGIYLGHVLLFLKMFSWQAGRRRTAVAFLFNNQFFSAR